MLTKKVDISLKMGKMERSKRVISLPSAQAIFEQVRIMQNTFNRESQDPRLPGALKTLGLPPSLPRAIETYQTDQEQRRGQN